MAAARLHKRLGTPLDRPVDVFLVAQRLGLWLASQPLDRAYGFYLKQGEAAGVVVNSGHPESLQRFTCAHEIGHHILEHESHTDLAETINSFDQANIQELQAQTFAAALLMPLPLVEQTLRKIVGSRHLTSAEEVYLFSRDIGVSYTAAVWHLAELNKLSRSLAPRLAKIAPSVIKDQLRGSGAISDSRADVWFFDGDRARIADIQCRVDDEVHIHIGEDLSTGYAWTIQDLQEASSGDEEVFWDGGDGAISAAPVMSVSDVGSYDGERLEVARNIHIGMSQSSLPGLDPRVRELQEVQLPGPGSRSIVLIPRAEGELTVQIWLKPAWDVEAPARDERTIALDVRDRKTLPVQGFAAPQRDIRALEMAA